MWRRAADEDANCILSSRFLPRVSVTVPLRVLGFVSDFRGFGCSVFLVYFLFYIEGFLSCFALIGHDCFQLPWLQEVYQVFLYQTNSCDWLLRSQLLTSIISASGGFRQTGADTKAELEPWGGWFISGRVWWNGGKENVKPCLNQMK